MNGKQWTLGAVNTATISSGTEADIDVKMGVEGVFNVEALSIRYPASRGRSEVKISLSGQEFLTSGRVFISQLGQVTDAAVGRDERPFFTQLRSETFLRFTVKAVGGDITAEELNISLIGKLDKNG